MSNADSDLPVAPLTLLALVVSVVVTGVVALGVAHVRAPLGKPAAVAVDPQPEPLSVLQLAFGADPAILPAGAEGAIADWALQARQSGRRVLVLSRATGDHGLEAARSRADAVVHALQANGLPSDQLRTDVAAHLPSSAATDGVELRWD